MFLGTSIFSQPRKNSAIILLPLNGGPDGFIVAEFEFTPDINQLDAFSLHPNPDLYAIPLHWIIPLRLDIVGIKDQVSEHFLALGRVLVFPVHQPVSRRFHLLDHHMVIAPPVDSETGL